MLGTMMKGDITPDLESGQRLFHAYGDDYFQLGQERIHASFYFHMGNIVSPWANNDTSGLQASDFFWLEAEAPEVLVIGTGRRTAFPKPDVLDYLSSLHIGFECMDSLSAARTFNILVGEGRKVATAMFLANVRG